MDPIEIVRQEMHRDEFNKYNEDELKSACKEIKESLETYKPLIEKELEDFKTILSAVDYAMPETNVKKSLKVSMERYIAQDEAALGWVKDPTLKPETLELVAERANRLAEMYLFNAKKFSSGSKMSKAEDEIMIETAGKLFYSANVIRQHIKPEE